MKLLNDIVTVATNQPRMARKQKQIFFFLAMAARAEQSSQARKSALADAARERARNPSFIDREPRLSGGPSG